MSAVLHTIEAFPNGRTTSELCALLDVDFDATKRASIRAELDNLSQQGVIRLGRDGKWRLTSRLGRPSFDARTGRRSEDNVSVDQEGLTAVPARFRVVTSAAEESFLEDEDEERPDPQSLLRYYRAAVRSDPRGALTQTLETYGTSHILLSGSGALWPTEDTDQSQIRIHLDALPDRFREALKRRDSNENALAIGWPISIGTDRSVPVVRPVGLIAGEWLHEKDELVVRIPHSDILVNPDWIRASARGTAWRASDLTAVFRATEGVGLSKEDFTERLKEAQASAIRGQLSGSQFASRIDPAQTGIHDALGLFLPTESTFTSGAVRDLDQIAAWSTQQLSETALAPLLGIQHERPGVDLAPINLGPINAEQYEAVKAAMDKPLTVVTGPPGTGKSQAIVAMAATALQSGKTVLVASKNHQALDAVEERLTGIAPDVKFLVRTLDPAKEIDVSTKAVLNEIIKDGSVAAAATDPFLTAQLQELAERRKDTFEKVALRRRLNLELADLIERRDLREDQVNSMRETKDEPRVSFWKRLLQFLRLASRNSAEKYSLSQTASLGRRELQNLIRERRISLDSLDNPPDPYELTEKITDLARSVVARTLSERTSIESGTRQRLQVTSDDLELQGHDALPSDVLESIVNARPLWLASVLGTPRRIPLQQGLFDLVIFDEASQCDIGTALPLFARARRAVVVGDDRQLAFISQIWRSAGSEPDGGSRAS